MPLRQLSRNFLVMTLVMTALPVGAAPAAPTLPAATEPEVRVRTCGERDAEFLGTVSTWLAPMAPLGVKVSVVADPLGCARSEGPQRIPSSTADISVQEWRKSPQVVKPPTTTKKASVSEAVPEGPVIRTRVSFATAERLTIVVSGRTFSAAIASRSLDFPSRSPGQGQTADDAPPPEALFVQGIAALTAYQRLASNAKERPAPAALTRVRERALVALDEADRRDVELFAPETSAVIKQLRALLILQGACSSDTAAGLLRAAVRLIPHDSEARAAAAIGRLLESNAPTVCPYATEQELLQSVALDRWSTTRVDDLGRFYELSMNASSARSDDTSAVAADLASQRLAQVWEGRAPPAPAVIELAVSAGMSKSVGSDWLRTLAPAARFEATLGRDSSGFGLRLGGTLPWTRELTLGDGTVSWTRLVFSAGSRYRNRRGRFYWEGEAAVLLAPAFATGHGFESNFSAVGLDAGGMVGARLGLRLGRFSLWAGASGSYFGASRIPGWPDLTIRVTGLPDTSTLPGVDVTILAGVSQMFWR